MNKPGKYLIAVLMLCMSFAGYGEQVAQVNKSKESYSVIIQRNIFSRDRSVRKPKPIDVRPSEPNIVSAPDIAFIYILRGVAIDTKNKIAFIENQSSGEFFQVSVGEQVDGMVIKAINSDRVVFDKNKSEVEIMVGMDMSGVIPGAPANTKASGSLGSSSSSSSSSGGKVSSPAIQDADEAEILRQMLERRKNQLE
ncbi:MAG: hypothetical protein K9M75_00570 [Phycisphaerae bacterium]|nr:hypothetical protein [Phycisphaerae bacterium]